MDKPDIKRGEDFMRAIVKASLYGLFSIGVRSQANIDRFIVAFTTKVESELEKLGITQPDNISVPPQKTPTPDANPTAPVNGTHQPAVTTPPPSNPNLLANIKELKLHPFIIKSLELANINTIEQLMSEMQKRPLTEIKGIKEKSQEQIRVAIKNYIK